MELVENKDNVKANPEEPNNVNENNESENQGNNVKSHSGKKSISLAEKLEKEQHEAEIHANHYKQLMRLLTKSQFYSSFLQARASDHLKSIQTTGKRKRQTDNQYQILKKQRVLLEQKAINQLKESETFEEEPKEVDVGTDEVGPTRLTALGVLVDAQQPLLLEGTELRDYQMAGFKWLKVLYETGMNGILADEMGLGKTIQSIAMICHLYEQGVIGPFLIVGPLTTVPNWLLEFERFCPQIPVVMYHGTQYKRELARSEISRSHPLNGSIVFPVVVTSYQLPIKDEVYLNRYRWKYIIVDEGHRLKNSDSQLSRSLRNFSSVNRLLLTGTPIQNNLGELWSLLNFLLPDIFDSLDAFQSWLTIKELESCNVEGSAAHVVEQEKKDMILSKLHEILSPFLLRRTKVDVNLQLPPKKELIIKCPLTSTQLSLYYGIADKSLQTLFQKDPIIIPENEDGTKVKRRAAIKHKNQKTLSNTTVDISCEGRKNIIIEDGQQYLMQLKFSGAPYVMLKKIVNHPYLIKMPILPGSCIMKVDENLITESGKMVLLNSLLGRLKAGNHKVVLFSTMTTILDIIEYFLDMRGYGYCRLDGTKTLDERKEMIFKFNTNPDVFVFLASTRAGGLGINLCSADTVIIYDSDWNPQADLQAQDRCHRIGQNKPVLVYRLVCPGTIDEDIIIKAHAKRKLEKLIIHKGNFGANTKYSTVSLEELKTILEEKIISKEIGVGAEDLSEEQWAVLLDRSDLAFSQ